MNPEQSHVVAVLDAVVKRRVHTSQVIAQLGLEQAVFGAPADLSALLAKGHRFSMLVLSFRAPISFARVALEHLVACAGPEMPIMLLMSEDQVELSTSVMADERSDFLLEPYTSQELSDRLDAHFSRWVRRRYLPDGGRLRLSGGE